MPISTRRGRAKALRRLKPALHFSQIWVRSFSSSAQNRRPTTGVRKLECNFRPPDVKENGIFGDQSKFPD